METFEKRRRESSEIREISPLLSAKRRSTVDQNALFSRLKNISFLAPFFEAVGESENSVSKLISAIRILVVEEPLKVVIDPEDLSLSDRLGFYVLSGSFQIYEKGLVRKASEKGYQKSDKNDPSYRNYSSFKKKGTQANLKSPLEEFVEKNFPNFEKLGCFSESDEELAECSFEITQNNMVISVGSRGTALTINLTQVQMIKNEFLREKHREKLRELKKIEELSEVSEDVIFALIGAGKQRSLRRNSKIIKVGQKVKSVFLLTRGAVELRGANGKSFGILFGYSVLGIEFLCEVKSGAASFYEAVCSGSQCEIIEISSKRFRSILKGSGGLEKRIMEEARRLHEHRENQMKDSIKWQEMLKIKVKPSMEDLNGLKLKAAHSVKSLANGESNEYGSLLNDSGWTGVEAAKDSFFQLARPFKSNKSVHNPAHLALHGLKKKEGKVTISNSVASFLENSRNPKKIELIRSNTNQSIEGSPEKNEPEPASHRGLTIKVSHFSQINRNLQLPMIKIKEKEASQQCSLFPSIHWSQRKVSPLKNDSLQDTSEESKDLSHLFKQKTPHFSFKNFSTHDHSDFCPEGASSLIKISKAFKREPKFQGSERSVRLSNLRPSQEEKSINVCDSLNSDLF